jgi:hypothetical protein
MDYFKNSIVKNCENSAHHSNNDEDTTDTETEDDSGIAEEIEAPIPPPPVKLLLPDLKITDTFTVQTNALNNFFNYW